MPSGRPATKKILKESEAKKLGELKAEWRFKSSKKGWKKSLRDHLGHWIDNINPIEVAAIGVGTVMIHGAIIKGGYIDQALTFWKGIAELASPLLWVGTQFGVFPKEIRVMPEDSIELWLTSFFFAYIFIKHGGQIMGLWSEGFTKAVGMMFA